MSDLQTLEVAICVAGILTGLTLLVRGLARYRRLTPVADVPTSHIATLAAGEVCITGRVEPAELKLVSPLQSRGCVYYRATVTAHQGRSSETLLHEERSVGFRVRDETGVIRVFPRGAAFDVPPELHDR